MKLSGIPFTSLLLLLIMVSCNRRPARESSPAASYSEIYAKAQQAAQEGKFEAALELYREAQYEGSKNFMQIVTDSSFYGMVNDPEFRPKVRKLLANSPRENSVLMVRGEEPGERIFIRGKVVDGNNGEPIPYSNVDLVQADANGQYFEEESLWNPRIFGYGVTDEYGYFFIETIRPGQYPDDEGNLVPAHIHFNLSLPGYRPFGGEFTFEDDTVLMANSNQEEVLVATFPKGKTEQKWSVTIPVEPL